MNEDATSPFKAVPNEGVTGGDMLQDILIVHIIDLYHKMLVGLEQIPIQRKP